MPTILRINGFRFFFYSNEHLPIPIHIEKDSKTAKFNLEWFRNLRNATKEQLERWRFIGKGEGIHWEELDEDISIENLLE